MKMIAAAIALLVAPAVLASGEGVTPVQKVVQLMEGMLEKGKSMKHEEQVQFAAYKQFCDDTSAAKEASIKKADEKIEVLQADIEMYLANIAKLSKEIAEHEADINAWAGDMKAATTVRGIEKAAYDDMHKDLSESVSALERAVQVLKTQSHDRKQASFVQVAALSRLRLIPERAKRALTAFLQEDPESDPLSVTAPEAFGYEFQSHGIISMLEKLLDEFIEERTKLEKEESNSVHQYKLLIQDLTKQTEQAKFDVSQKSELLAKNKEDKAGAEGELAETKDLRDADQKYLDDLTAECTQKAADFESRQQLRAEELVAIEKAIEIISSSSVKGHADTHLPSMLQKAKGQAFAALRVEATSQQLQNKVAQYLQRQASRTGSRVLSLLAVRVRNDPFGKVKKLIKDLIVRLMDEATSEAEHKGWCDTELATNEHTRKEKTAAVTMLHAEIDELSASIAKETEEIAELVGAIADLDKAMAEATELRKAEKEKNEETIADAQEAQTAVAQAMTVLKDFYSKASEATALIQQGQQQEPPPIFDSPYTGMGDEHGGVVGMLEVIESDFARLEAETKASEAAAQKEYETFMTDSKVDKEGKETDVEHKTAKKGAEEQALTSTQSDLEGTQKELDAALAYFDKLKPSCVSEGVDYDERVQRRAEEIESLQEALKILNGKEIA